MTIFWKEKHLEGVIFGWMTDSLAALLENSLRLGDDNCSMS